MVVPSKEELEQAIESFVKENKTADLTQVKQFIGKQNPSWQVPDRRLRKFLKNQMVQSESAVVGEMASKKPRFSLKMFGAKSKSDVKIDEPPAPATAPPPEEEDDAPSPIQEEKPPVANVVPSPAAETTAETKEVTVTQMDDTGIDGEEEKPCFACASCVVM